MDCKEEFSRSARVIGCGAIERLKHARVAVFGVGGVGGYVCEALARAGVGAIDLFDSDAVSLSNVNRQIIALHSTVGQAKVEVMRARILDVNPDCEVTVHNVFYLPENADDYPLDGYDYIADAIDTVAAKLELIVRATRAGIPIISSMGCGNRLDPSKLRLTDLYETSGDPLSKIMRHELRKRGVKKLSVVSSAEKPIRPVISLEELEKSNPDRDPDEPVRRSIPASSPFVPPAAGLLIASKVVMDLINWQPQK
jgi:tRNA A37 threonylcarbamoyladenosine dehydratase